MTLFDLRVAYIRLSLFMLFLGAYLGIWVSTGQSLMVARWWRFVLLDWHVITQVREFYTDANRIEIARAYLWSDRLLVLLFLYGLADVVLMYVVRKLRGNVA